ncbi:hypothetical protein [Micromonospora sp. CPCC 206061]
MGNLVGSSHHLPRDGVVGRICPEASLGTAVVKPGAEAVDGALPPE